MKHKALAALLLAVLWGVGLNGIALALIGDLVVNGVVDAADMAILSAAFGSHSWNPISPNWDIRADLNRDDRVNLTDLTIAGRNFGDTFNFHAARRLFNGRGNNPCLSTIIDTASDVDANGKVSIVFVDNTNRLYYTKVDPSGNTLVDDLYLDSNVDTGPAIAVDSQGNVHITYYALYDPPNLKDGLLYTELDKDGEIIVGETLVCNDCNSGENHALAVDQYDHPHILVRDLINNDGAILYYILDDNGQSLLNWAHINTHYTELTSGLRPAIDVDGAGTRTMLWYEDTPGAGGDLVFSRIAYGGLPNPNQLVVGRIDSWNARRFTVRSDSHGAAHVLWSDTPAGGVPGTILWRRINPDGSLTPASGPKIITTDGLRSASSVVDFEIDDQDRIHLVAKNRLYRMSYARLDRDGNALVSFQPFLYDEDPSHFSFTLSPQGQGALSLSLADVEMHCAGSQYPLYVVSTAPDAQALDRTRADVEIDSPHIQASTMLARVIDSVTISVTVHNAGWVTAQPVTLTMEETIAHTPIAQAVIPSIAPLGATTVVRTFNIPDLEETTALPIRIVAATSTPETTLSNNVFTLTLGVIPPVTAFDLSVLPLDETYAPTDRNLADPLLGAQLDLDIPAGGYHDEIASTYAYNGFLNVPLTKVSGSVVPTTINLTLSKTGFTQATQQLVVDRMAGNPYYVTITPSSPIKMYLNQWGDIAGKVYTGTSGTVPIEGASVTLDGSQTVQTDSQGSFTFTKVVSGTHTVEAVHAGNEIKSSTFQVLTGQTAGPILYLPGTTKGYVRGVVYVLDILTSERVPAPGVTVRLKSGASTLVTTASGEDGSYAFTLSQAGDCSTCNLEAVYTSEFETYTGGTFALQAGIPYAEDIDLVWKTSWGGLFASDQSVFLAAA